MLRYEVYLETSEEALAEGGYLAHMGHAELWYASRLAPICRGMAATGVVRSRGRG